MYVYITSEPGLWTVGFYDSDGKWHAESDHESVHGAALRVSYLNGGQRYEPEERAFDRTSRHVCPTCGRVTNAR